MAKSPSSPEDHRLAFHFRDADSAVHTFSVANLTIGADQASIRILPNTEVIGYQRRHLSSRYKVLHNKIHERINDLVHFLVQRNKSSTNSTAAMVISAVNATDPPQDVENATGDTAENETSNTTVAPFRYVDITNPGDIYSFLKEQIGTTALQEATNSKPLKVRDCAIRLQIVCARWNMYGFILRAIFAHLSDPKCEF